MNRKKLSPEEIQALRANAEKERAEHAEVMKNLRAVTMSPTLQMTTLMSSYNRHRKDEIMAMLTAFASGDKRYELCSEVKSFIYSHGEELSEAKSYMLQNMHLGYTLEKLIFDDKVQPFVTTNSGKLIYPKFCADAEVYMVNETLNACQKAFKLTGELHFLDTYTQEHALCNNGEEALMEFLFVTTGLDSVLDALSGFVLTYISRHPSITPEACLRAIKSGNHEVIMQLIKLTSTLTENSLVADALLKRADEEEVTAYFNRWAREN